MKGLILAAGYGTRLYPLTLDKPKPLLEIGGKTILERLLNKLEEVESCDGAYIITNDKFFGVMDNWAQEHSFRFPLDIINDNTVSNNDRLGAIGDIELVIEKREPKEDLLIMAGDNLFEFEINDYVSFAQDKGCLSVALFDVKNMELAKKYGIVSLDEGQKVVDFQEKPEIPQSTLASTGIYYLPSDRIASFSDYMKTGNSKDAPGNFVKWSSENGDVYGYVFTDGWYDIGDKISLQKADEEYRNKGL